MNKVRIGVSNGGHEYEESGNTVAQRPGNEGLEVNEN
jgi:hypothetical protein